MFWKELLLQVMMQMFNLGRFIFFSLIAKKIGKYKPCRGRKNEKKRNKVT